MYSPSFNMAVSYSSYVRSNLSNALLGKNGGLKELWILEKLKWSGWLKVRYISSDADCTVHGFFEARVNSVLFNVLWTCGPVFISILSFFAYVMQGNRLTVSVAFTVRYCEYRSISLLYFNPTKLLWTVHSIVQHDQVNITRLVYFRRRINSDILELRLMSFQHGFFRFSRFVLHLCFVFEY